NISGATISVGDGVAGDSATLRFGADNQIANTNNNIQVASNGTLDLAGNDQIIGNLTLEVGPLGGGAGNVGARGTLTLTGNLTVQSVGGGGATGAAITGGTLGLNTFNASGGAFQRTFLVNDAAAGTDLMISSAIVDGTGFQSAGIIKNGFGTLQFDGA